MKRVASLSVLFFYSLFVSAKTGEIWVNFYLGEKEDKGVIGILKNEDGNLSAVMVRKNLKPGKYTFKVKEGKYLVICMKYSYNHSFQRRPIIVKSGSVTEVICKGHPDSDFIELRGVVIDKESGLPIAGAKVGYPPYILPSGLLPHYSLVIEIKNEKLDAGDEVRFLKKYSLDKYLYFPTDRKGNFKIFIYKKAVADFGFIYFSVIADGYAPFFYKKKIGVKEVFNTKNPLDVGTLELVSASSFKLSLVPSLKKNAAVYLKPVNTEIESFPRYYFLSSPYRRFGTSSKNPIFVKDSFIWSFLSPWVYSVEWRIKENKRSRDASASLAVYEVKEKENKEVSLDVNDCEYEIEVVGFDKRGNDEGKVDFDISIIWRGKYRVIDFVSFKDLKEPIKVRDISRGRSFIEVSVRYGEEGEVFIKEIGEKIKFKKSDTTFYSRVMMEDCARDSKVKIKLEDGELSFVIRDDKGKPIKGASVIAYLYKEGYEPSFSCWTSSDEKGRAVCKFLKSGEYLVLVRHSKGYFGPKTFTTGKDSYEITLKKGKNIEVELLSPEYKPIGMGLVMVAALRDTPFSILSTLRVEGEESKPYRILGLFSKKEYRYIARFTDLPYLDIYIFPETQVTKLGRGWSKWGVLVGSEEEDNVQLVLEMGSGAVVFQGKNTGVGFDDAYKVSICKKGAECLPSSFFTPPKFFSPTGGFVITGLSPGEYKVRLIPIDLGEGRESLETPFFKIYADQHTIVEEGSFRR